MSLGETPRELALYSLKMSQPSERADRQASLALVEAALRG